MIRMALVLNEGCISNRSFLKDFVGIVGLDWMPCLSRKSKSTGRNVINCAGI